MKIFIDNVIEDGQDKGELYLESTDDRNINLVQYRLNSKTGKVSAAILGYFTDRNSALKRVLKMEVHASTITTIHEVIKDNERIEKKMDAWIPRALEVAQ
jgi:hypothetical protein